MSATEPPLLQALLDCQDQAEIWAVLDSAFPTLDAMDILRLQLYQAVGHWFDVLDADQYQYEELGYEGTFVNGLARNQDAIGTWLRRQDKTLQSQEETTYDLGKLLFCTNYYDWDEYEWGTNARRLELEPWYDGEFLTHILPLLPQLQPWIAESPLLSTMLELSMSDLMEFGILQYARRYPAERLHPQLKALQLQGLKVLAETLLVRKPASELAREMLVLFHAGSPHGDRNRALLIAKELGRPVTGRGETDMILHELLELQDLGAALRRTQALMQRYYDTRYALSRSYLWSEAEEGVLQALLETFSDPTLLEPLAAQYCAVEPRALHFRAFLTRFRTGAPQVDLLLQILDRLSPTQFLRWGFPGYEIIHSRTYSSSYAYMAYEDHFKAVALLPLTPSQSKELLRRLEYYAQHWSSGWNAGLQKLRETCLRSQEPNH